VGRLERAIENPTVGILDRLASTLNADISELFRSPRSGESFPKPLRSARPKAGVRARSSRKT
jgi:transcriptional regulator with XRE-family HTH domain